MSERELSDCVSGWVLGQGGRAVRLAIAGVRGWPDLTIFIPDAKTFFVELKTSRGELSQNQIQWIKFLESRGEVVGVCRSLEDVEELYEKAKV